MKRVSFFRKRRGDTHFCGYDGSGILYKEIPLLYPRKWVSILLFSLFIILPLNAYETIDIEKAKQYYETNSALFIDARDFKKYIKGTIAKAINVPLKRYKRFKKFLPIDKNATIVTFCGGINCKLSKKLSLKLERLGYSNIKQFSQGFPKWKALKLPIMAKPIKCSAQKTKKLLVDGIEVVLNDDNTINIDWFRSLKKVPNGLLIVDVREKKEYQQAHIKGALSLPFKGKLNSKKLNRAKAVILYCNSGIKSANAKESLDDSLKKKVFIIDEPIMQYYQPKKDKNIY